jgi:hypothetical protein
MRRYWYIGVVVVILAIVGGGVARIQWANSIPSRPKDLPVAAVWVPAPPAPLDFSPRGYWLACWLNKSQNQDYCKVTDYKGTSDFEGDFSPVAGSNPIPDNDLHLKKVETGSLWAWSEQDQRTVPVVHLDDGTILVPMRNLAELRHLYFSTGKP